ncbi:tyrosine-protein phosphatase [Costertonia aggregata]|uniref:protein-tyrosine-phosphatase n=1 Tax=Costertonia aggregata TaxID=343403 RepID=A0A7H9ATG5_9FLAO|nr:CpsB/CapC family capsule biosynthesis tyrosine phosphatase [Costertonia aggregata]QLG46716.1 histidinol phosphatase [Costertonia aggregata]
MFDFFIKKKFLVDYLKGFVDIHNHILPGIDDGAKTIDDSIQLIKGFSEIGVKKFICTPHIMNNYYPNTPETILSSYNSLKDGLLDSNLKEVSIEVSAEHMIDDNFENILKNGKIMPMRKNYLLIEMSYLQASINFNGAVAAVASERFFPILAHPERYIYLHDTFSKYGNYKEKGILFQLNLLSLTDFYGKDVQKAAFRLLDERLIDYVASDVHNMNQLRNLKEVKVSNTKMKTLIPVIERTIDNFF